jgi:hypothetical protein
MRRIELTNRLVKCLSRKLREANGRARQFTPKELAQEIDGAYAGSIGHVAEEVVSILRGDGWNIRYDRIGNPKRFLINP